MVTGRPPGRPSNGDRVSTQVRLPRPLYDWLVEQAAERDVSVNWLVTRAVERLRGTLRPVEDVVRTRDREGT